MYKTLKLHKASYLRQIVWMGNVGSKLKMEQEQASGVRRQALVICEITLLLAPGAC
jgi:hypothetical protein